MYFINEFVYNQELIMADDEQSCVKEARGGEIPDPPCHDALEW